MRCRRLHLPLFHSPRFWLLLLERIPASDLITERWRKRLLFGQRHDESYSILPDWPWRDRVILEALAPALTQGWRTARLMGCIWLPSTALDLSPDGTRLVKMQWTCGEQWICQTELLRRPLSSTLAGKVQMAASLGSQGAAGSVLWPLKEGFRI